jgi:hypothetical protein
MELNIEIEQECPICLNDIQENDAYLLLSCCYKKVHIICLDNWYNNNGKKNKICFLCTKESNDVQSIIARSPIMRSHITEEDNITLINNDYDIYKYCVCIFMVLLFFSILLLILIYIIVF